MTPKKTSRADEPPIRAWPTPASWIKRYRERFPSASPNLLSLLFAVRSTAQQLDNAHATRLSQTGLTPARYHMLMVLWGNDGPISFTELGSFLAITRATVSALVDSMVQDGIVLRLTDASDRRNALVSLTDKGEKLFNPILDTHFEDMRVLFANFTEADIVQFLGLLARFRANTERLTEDLKPVVPGKLRRS